MSKIADCKCIMYGVQMSVDNKFSSSRFGVDNHSCSYMFLCAVKKSVFNLLVKIISYLLD